MSRIIQHADRLLTHLILPVLVAGVLLVPASAAHAAATPEQKCQKGRYDAAAKYSACQQKVLAKFFAGGDYNKFLAAASKCRVKYTAVWPKLQAKTPGSTCDAVRFAVSGGTVTDNLTGLQWEQKTDDGSVHDKDNVYTWSVSAPAANGSAYTDFLVDKLNSGACFAGQCDWRLPTLYELQTILSEAYPCTTSPCIDQAVFGPTLAYGYWSANTVATSPNSAWFVFFGDGDEDSIGKSTSDFLVRAVRAGL